jgi:hypothetical protein
MTTYLEDTKDLRVYDGAAWSSPFGATLIARSAFSGAATVSLNNVFTSAYNNYEVYVSFVGSGVTGVNMRLRASGTDLSSSTYSWMQVTFVDTTDSKSAQNGTTSWDLNAARVGFRTVSKMTMFSPARSGVTKSMLHQAQDFTGAAIVYRSQVSYNSTTSVYDGFSIRPDSGTLTGEVEVYGMRI